MSDMSKNKMREYLVIGIVLILFLIIAFVVPFSKTATFWVGLVFGVIAITSQMYFLASGFSGDSPKSKFYGFPVFRIGIIYLGAQIVISIIELACAEVLPVWVAIVLNVLLLAFACLGCITTEIVRDEVVRQEVKVRMETGNMTQLRSLSADIADRCIDTNLKADLKKLAEEFKYSDPVSSGATSQIEAEMWQMMNEMSEATNRGNAAQINDLCKELVNKLSERNRICKISKNNQYNQG